MIAPTIACDVETGSFNFVIPATVRAAAKATVKEPANALTAPSLPKVWEAPAPPMVAPSNINIEAVIAAVLNLIILVPTAVPYMFAASFAPNDQPRNNPLVKNIKNI
jgi:hypothetical protein